MSFKKQKIFFLILFFLSVTSVVQAFCPRNAPSRVANKFERHYDTDGDGCLNFAERGRYRTHQILGWELADTKKKKKHDLNKDMMLNPYEWQKYQEDLKNDPKVNLLPLLLL